jgi:MYXO-CTERM domain-containing protein
VATSFHVSLGSAQWTLTVALLGGLALARRRSSETNP